MDSAESLSSLFFCLPPADMAFSRSLRNWLRFKLLDRPLQEDNNGRSVPFKSPSDICIGFQYTVEHRLCEMVGK